MIYDLYSSEISLAKTNIKYDIAKSTINGWVKDNKKS